MQDFSLLIWKANAYVNLKTIIKIFTNNLFFDTFWNLH